MNRSQALREFPWATTLTTVIALTVFLWPAAAAALVYDRSRVLQGEWWRILTGNWVHFTRSQLFWNLAVLVPAGLWSERQAAARTRWLFLAAPLLIGVIVFNIEADISRFGGLSGVAAGVVVLLALNQLRVAETDRWFWRFVILLVALKIAAEAMLASPWLAHYPDPTARSVALTHLAGVAAAVCVHYAGRRRRMR